MFKPTILLPLLFILGAGVGCKDDEPTGAQFGEACGDVDCAEGLECFTGYCAETCMEDADCRPLDGFSHVCRNGGVCWIACEAPTYACPDDLEAMLVCGPAVDGLGYCGAS